MKPEAVSEVRSVLLPLAEGQLLLPNAVVAEVVNYQPPESVKDAPEWYLGTINWRGISLPVISFEVMLGGTVMEPGHRGRIVVMNTLNANQSLTHLGLVTQSIPSLVRVTEENVAAGASEVDFAGLVTQSVTVNDGLALIPDLDELEQRLVQVLD